MGRDTDSGFVIREVWDDEASALVVERVPFDQFCRENEGFGGHVDGGTAF